MSNSLRISRRKRTENEQKECKDELKDRSLYLRFHHRLTDVQEDLEKEIKQLSSLIKVVRRPRQPASRFCFVDFDTVEDCSQALIDLREVKINKKNIFARPVNRDNKKFIQAKIKLQKKSADARLKIRKMKKEMKRAIKKGSKAQTNTLIIDNIPNNSTEQEVKDLFPEAIEFVMKYPTLNRLNCLAFVTVPTPQDAFKLTKEVVTLNGSTLSVRFSKSKNASVKTEKMDESDGEEDGSDDEDDDDEDNDEDEEMKVYD